jgi:hypothetical protein
MHINKTAAYNQAFSEIARFYEKDGKQKIMMYDAAREEYVCVGTASAKTARKFQNIYILTRMLELIRTP